MQVLIVSDSQGNIQMLSSAPQKGETSGATMTPVLKAGERMDVLDVPAAFEKKQPAELHAGLRVVTQGGEVTLVATA